MAETYAFSLAGALLLARSLPPVLCFAVSATNDQAPARSTWLVRTLQAAYLRQLQRCLRHKVLTLVAFAAMVAATAAVVPMLGREFLPELEEGNMWIAGTFPLKTSLDEVCRRVQDRSQDRTTLPGMRTADDADGSAVPTTAPTRPGFYGAAGSLHVPLKPHDQWPIPPGQTRPRTKEELVDALNREISETMVSTDWNFSQNIRNNVNETLSGVRGDNSVKIIGPDLAELEHTAGSRVVRAPAEDSRPGERRRDPCARPVEPEFPR